MKPDDTGVRRLTRRRLLLGAAAAVGVGALAVGTTTAIEDGVLGEDGAVGERTAARRGALLELPDTEASMAAWRADVDQMAAGKLDLVRCGPAAYLIAPAPGQWSSEATSTCQQALDYARSKGMRINMVLPGAPDWAQNFAFDDYLRACKTFWNGMNERFGGRVDIFQVFNEADGAHFQHFDSITLDAAYLDQFGTLLGAAHDIFHSQTASFTTNLLGWPMSDEREQAWYHVLDSVGKHLDIISLDLYPADNRSEIEKLPDRIRRVAKRYAKQVYVSEIGLQTEGSWDDNDQRVYVSAALEKIGAANPWGVCLYRWRDSGADDLFGIYTADRTPKSGRDQILSALQRV